MGELIKADTFPYAVRVLLSLQRSITIPVALCRVEDEPWQSLILIRDTL